MNCSVSSSTRGRHTVWWAREIASTLLNCYYSSFIYSKTHFVQATVSHDARVRVFSCEALLPDVRWSELSVEQQQRGRRAVRSGHVSVKHDDKPFIHSVFSFFPFLAFVMTWLDLCSFDALVLRFEAPDSRNRWDCPLFTILKDDVLPFQAICDALFNRKAPAANQSTQSVRNFVAFLFFIVFTMYAVFPTAC